MNSNFDPLYEKYANFDFADAKPASAVPCLAALHAQTSAKTRVSMQLDNSVLAVFKARAEMAGKSYQALMRSVLQQSAQSTTHSPRVAIAAA
jgi:predicted DNA binding CopG/RHH family protein